MQVSTIDLRTLPYGVKQLRNKVNLPQNYEYAKMALAECQSVDECKDMADKATAMAIYAKQIKDTEMTDIAKKIKVRAQLRLGELLNELSNEGKSLNKRGDKWGGKEKSERTKASEKVGLSKNIAYMVQRAARVKKELKEKMIEERKPLVQIANSAPPNRIGGAKGKKFSDSWSLIMGYNRGYGRVPSFVKFIQETSPRNYAPGLHKDEAKKIRQCLVKIQEWCDEMDQRMVR